MEVLETMELEKWENVISKDRLHHAIESLENGKVLFFPSLAFSLAEEEKQFLCSEKVDPKTKNISYDLRTACLGGTLCMGDEAHRLKEMMHRYAITSRKFMDQLLPHYASHLIQAKTSFRPVEIFGRNAASYRKDDTRLHVDAFPSNPTKGHRILRIFTNINDRGMPRVWRLGEPFEDVVKTWAPKVSSPIWGISALLYWLKITKNYRTPYDHYMLQMHNKMKKDIHYQKNVRQERVHFPAGSSWIVFTDQVSHAAMSGQHVLEQTFHLPVHALKDESKNPLKVLEKFLKRPLLT